ncbi:Uncharacterized zinc-type alcohol dehydrogenase-like protein YahK [Tatumella ptyseos]|uniref:Uncharacterized zinc-type alcohol dehydrogenase-like protein YahK n=1 Tax=Tatumella ptyseos TaxID=82987 RepID=A0A2X5P1N1_9GAMM|nr:Uncharacterized zinc-type alcohol dehydrogenase-like protein YahK [Tatumella ptyseos]
MSKIKSYAAAEAGAALELQEFDAGELAAEDVEVTVEYCGICHSDLSMIDNEWGISQYPLVAGHEVVGRVSALGSAAENKGLKVGQRVGLAGQHAAADIVMPVSAAVTVTVNKAVCRLS